MNTNTKRIETLNQNLAFSIILFSIIATFIIMLIERAFGEIVTIKDYVLLFIILLFVYCIITRYNLSKINKMSSTLEQENIFAEGVVSLNRFLNIFTEKWFLTKDILIFKSNKTLLFKTKLIEMPLNEIAELTYRKSFGLCYNTFTITTFQGQKYVFTTYNDKEWLEELSKVMLQQKLVIS